MKQTDRNERVIRRYLLGELPEEDQTQLEEQYFADDNLYLELQTIERDLIDSYVRGKLSSADHKRFESHFLLSPQRRQRVEFARAFTESISDIQSIPVPSIATKKSVSRWRSLLQPLRADNWRMALVTAVLLLVVGGVFLMIQILQLRHRLEQSESDRAALQKREQELQRQIGEAKERTDHLGQEAERRRREADLLEEELTRRQSEPRPEPVIASFVLVPSLVREAGETKRLVIPREAKLVRLRLLVEGDEYKSYRAEIHTVEGREVSRPQPTKSGKTVVLKLPSQLLTEGDYLVTLKGVTATGDAEGVGKYFFRVVRR